MKILATKQAAFFPAFHVVETETVPGFAIAFGEPGNLKIQEFPATLEDAMKRLKAIHAAALRTNRNSK